MFIDATYEGDLMAAAGRRVPRRPRGNAQYGETLNGVQTGVLHHSHQFASSRSIPTSVPGDPKSGLLPRIHAGAARRGRARRTSGAGVQLPHVPDRRPENRIPFPKPDGYDPMQYELLAPLRRTAGGERFDKFDHDPQPQDRHEQQRRRSAPTTSA